jgi:FtsP/CotA-like multicopper oxidase with cupredoxin domain
MCVSQVAAAQRPRVVPNDQRIIAGVAEGATRRVALEIVEADWRPKGETGVTLQVPVFREVGKAAMVPGPLLRVREGQPLEVSVRNTLAKPVAVMGLVDRTDSTLFSGFAPMFATDTSLLLAPGASRTVRFTPSRAVTSFYFARVVEPPSPANAPLWIPAMDGTLVGALVVDPASGNTTPDERLLVITRWDAPTEPASPGGSWKLFINGQAWPQTERFRYAQGDSVHWRVLNLSLTPHPMHLHGFFFAIDARSDGQRERTFTPATRELAVTHQVGEFEAVRLSWVAAEPGNWLYHCHLIRHMSADQLFDVERRARATAHDATTPTNAAADAHGPSAGDGSHADHDMAGLVVGITITPRGVRPPEPKPARALALWTGRRDGVFGREPGLGFVLQEGAVPAPDSVRAVGSTLVLREGEPTRITLHNRLTIPLSVHWHGLELRALYDGVGGWSGAPGATRGGIAPGDSAIVQLTPPRAGTFMYHVHGEPGHELSEGLYGALLVLPKGAVRDTTRDRLFMLGATGGAMDSPPAINGQRYPAPAVFTKGVPVRLRFAHMSGNETKRVRVLRDTTPVQWRPLARDGAALPVSVRTLQAAVLELGVGETRDVEWTPDADGPLVLEVRSSYYPSNGQVLTQRQAIAVGDVSAAQLRRLAYGVDLPVIALTDAEQNAALGRFRETGAVSSPRQLSLWEQNGQLRAVVWREGDAVSEAFDVLPFAGGGFAFGRAMNGQFVEAAGIARLHGLDQLTRWELREAGAAASPLAHAPPPVDDPATLNRFVGRWQIPEGPVMITELHDGVLQERFEGTTDAYPLERLSPVDFLLRNFSTRLRFEFDGTVARAIIFEQGTQPPQRLPRIPETSK